MQTLYLTRRNLNVLLSKLDRNKEVPGSSECTIIKQDTVHPVYPCSDIIEVTAVEDAAYYTDRVPGKMHPADNPGWWQRWRRRGKAVKKSIFSLKGGWLVVLWLCCSARADQWEFFRPELVRKYGCRVQQVDLRVYGMDRGTLLWDAEAYATRADNTTWIMEVGRYALTPKGRHEAEKACSKWQDEAEKRVRKAQ